MAKQIVEELVGVLGLDVNDASFKKGDQALGKTGVSFSHVAAMATAAAGAVQAAISGMVLSFAESADASGKFASRIGVSVEGLTSLRHAVEQTSTATGQQFNTGLQRMTRRISEANAGSKGLAEGLKELGLEAAVLAKMSPDEQFLAIADAMKEVENSGDQTRLTMKFFDSEAVELVNTLRLGSDAIRDLQKDARELGIVLSDEDAKAAAEFNDQLDIAQKSLGGVKNEIGRNLLPVFTELAVTFSEFVKDNKELIQGGLLRFFEGFAFVMKAAAVATGLFLAFKLGAALTGMMVAMRGLTFATLAFNASALLIPIAIGLGIAALGIIAEDILTYIKNGEEAETMTGRLLDKFELIRDVVNGVAAAFKFLGTVIGESVGSGVVKVDSLLEKIGAVSRSTQDGGGFDFSGFSGLAAQAVQFSLSPINTVSQSVGESVAGAVSNYFNIDATGMDSGELNAAIDQRMGQKNSEAVQANSTGKAI
tara:strand:- start:6766 stop:8208 length:1443 start_codon:yes stop_codon:yes gene_type:complete